MSKQDGMGILRWRQDCFVRLAPLASSVCYAVALSLVPVSGTYADDVTYHYDQLGRLIEAANETTSQATIYTYDAAGNIASTKVVSLDSVAVAGFAPIQGPAGTVVTLYGSGFDSTPSQNAVSFNGATATAMASTASELTVAVPAGASTGPVSVTVGGNTATSEENFTVSAGNTPSITGFNPAGGPAGTSVAISGTNFQTNGNNKVTFSESLGVVSSATASSIAVPVPSPASSGKIRVTTPYGVATSATDFIVPPSGYTMGSVGSTGRVPTDGSSSPVSLPTSNRISIQMFEGTSGQYFTLGISNNTVASATLSVYKPDGTLLVSSPVTSTTTGVALPKLPLTGTYSVVIDPGSNTGSMTIRFVTPLTGSLTVGGASLPLNLTPAGQRAMVTFNATAGQYLTLGLGGNTVANATYTVMNQYGAVMFSMTALSSTAGLQFPKWPTTGTYKILVETGTSSGSVNLSLVNAQSGSLTVNGSQLTLSLAPAGQRALITFAGTTGQYLSLALTSVTIASGTVTVLNPDATTLSSIAISPSGGILHLPKLTQSGTYTLFVDPTVNSGNITLAVRGPVTGSVSPNSSTSIDLIPTRRGLVSFPGTTGYFTLTVQEGAPGVGGTNDIPGLQLTVFAPDGTIVATPAFNVSCNVPQRGAGCYGNVILNLGPNLASGTYTVLAQQTGGTGGRLTFTASEPLNDDTLLRVTAPALPTKTLTVSPAGRGMRLRIKREGTGAYQLQVQETNSSIPKALIRIEKANSNELITSGILGAPCGCTGATNHSGTLTLGGNWAPAEFYWVYVDQITDTGTPNYFGPLNGSLTFTFTFTPP